MNKPVVFSKYGGKEIIGENLDKLIDLYYNYKCLWDITSKECKDINARNKTYSTIADILNISVETVK